MRATKFVLSYVPRVCCEFRMCALCSTCTARLKRSPNRQHNERALNTHRHIHIHTRTAFASITRRQSVSHGHNERCLCCEQLERALFLSLRTLVCVSRRWRQQQLSTAIAKKHMVLSSMCEISCVTCALAALCSNMYWKWIGAAAAAQREMHRPKTAYYICSTENKVRERSRASNEWMCAAAQCVLPERFSIIDLKKNTRLLIMLATGIDAQRWMYRSIDRWNIYRMQSSIS